MTDVPQTMVTVPYQSWIGYNILKYMAQYPLVASGAIAGIAALISYANSESEPPHPTPVPSKSGMNALITFGIVFAIAYVILWYYGKTLFTTT